MQVKGFQLLMLYNLERRESLHPYGKVWDVWEFHDFVVCRRIAGRR